MKKHIALLILTCSRANVLLSEERLYCIQSNDDNI